MEDHYPQMREYKYLSWELELWFQKINSNKRYNIECWKNKKQYRILPYAYNKDIREKEDFRLGWSIYIIQKKERIV